MIVEMISGLPNSSMSSFGYAFVDMNQDAVKEMLWIREDGALLAVYTMYNGTPVLLDAFWSRHKATILDSGELYVRDSDGANTYEYSTRILRAEGLGFIPLFAFGFDGETCFKKRVITEKQ